MSYINNMNPRRMIWFNQNAPKNKMDLWLSYNRHYEDTSEDETVDPQLVDDNPSQRKCDLILKAWDCGKWVPIVGFNTAAANKIDTVEGNTLYHPAIFTGENPNDLYDAGSLGELLKDTHFVTEEDWKEIYNEYIKTIIEQYPFDLWPAEQNELGGIFADRFASTHIDSTVANKTWMAQCKYKYNASSNYNLYIHAKDIISAVTNYQTDHPNEPGIQPGGDFELWLANTLRIGGIKAALDPNSGDEPRNIPIVLAGPEQGSVWGLPFGSGYYPQDKYPGDLDHDTEYLYLPGWALIDWMENPGPGVEIPVPYTPSQIIEVLEDVFKNTSSIGWGPLSLASNPTVSPHIWGADNPLNAGKFLRIKNPYPSEGTGWAQNNHAMEWIDIVAGDGVSIENVTSGGVTSMVISAEGSQDTWRPISAMISLHEQPIPSGNALYIAEGTGVNININTVGSGTTLTFSASGTDYTGTNLINVSGSVIGIDMSSNPSNGDVIICDSGVAKWGATPNPKFSGLSINANNGDATLNGLVLSSNASLQIEGEQSTRSEYSLNTWNYYNISNFKSFNIEDVPDEMEPIYIRLIESTAAVGCTGDIIDIGDVLSSPSGKDIFITMQFNIAKFEEINVLSTPVINDQN